MPTEITSWIFSSYYALNRSLGFMAWNTFLALIPWAMSLWLFRLQGASVRRVSWWVGLIIFIAFLPNAPYVLTDIIHLVRFIREGTPMETVVFILMPQYFLFMLIGTQAYVLSLINLGRYLHRQGQKRWVGFTELSIHALCAFGIYLGRVPRFNSWDLLHNPGQIASFIRHGLFQPQPLAVVLVMFIAIAAIYWPLKHISLALMLYWQQSPKARLRYRLGQPLDGM
jgi:uncharacterized membrane protein